VVDFLADDPILLAFLVVGIGAAIGSIRIRGISIGPAAALFVGLAVGAIDESLSGAGGLTILRELGLVLFTYTIGLAAGPTFFAGLRRGGIGTVAVTFAPDRCSTRITSPRRASSPVSRRNPQPSRTPSSAPEATSA